MKATLKAAVRGCYDAQKIRIQMGNRIVANYKARMGLKPGIKEDSDRAVKKILDQIRADYKLMVEGVTEMPRESAFTGTPLISSYAELLLVGQHERMLWAEKQMFASLKRILPNFKIYPWMENVTGLGPAMSGVLVSEIDIAKAEYPSSLFRYAGLDVGDDGAGRSKRSEHLVDREYTKKDGTVGIKKSITYNPFLKTKLTGVLGPSFIKQGERCPYTKLYYDYKNRLANHPKHKDKTLNHRHRMAMRYMIKRFLVDLYAQWRQVEGLPVAEPYEVAKLGIKHGKAA